MGICTFSDFAAAALSGLAAEHRNLGTPETLEPQARTPSEGHRYRGYGYRAVDIL